MPRAHARPLAALLIAALAATALANKPPPPTIPAPVMASLADNTNSIVTALDNALTANVDPKVNVVRVPALAAGEVAFTHLAERLEDPALKAAIKPAYDKGSDAIATATRAWEGPVYDATPGLRQALGDKIMGVAKAVEGEEKDWTDTPDPAANFIPPFANVFGRKALTPGAGRVISSGFFSLVPKPPMRNASEPKREGDPVWPSDLSDDPTGTPDGVCKPWEAPEGYKNVLDYCKAMRKLPKSHWEALYNETSVTRGEPFPMSGCVFGCLVGNDTYTSMQHETSVGFGWAGKCFSKDRDADGIPKAFGTMLGHDYMIPTGRNQSERVSVYTGAGDYIFTGKGRFQDKSYFDGKPVYQFVDDRPTIGMLTSGGWRTFHTLAQAFADGVTDEFRPLGDGMMLGKTFYTPPIFRGRVRADTNFFLMFQSCTADGKIPWRPAQREVPLVGAE